MEKFKHVKAKYHSIRVQAIQINKKNKYKLILSTLPLSKKIDWH